MILAQNWPKTAKFSWHCSFKTAFYVQSVMLSPRLSQQSPVRSPQSTIRSPQSAIRSPQSAVRSPQSAVRGPRSAVRGPRSAVRGPQSAFHILYWPCKSAHKRCLFRRYARRRAFIIKTRTIILSANTTLIRLAFGVIATGQSHSRNNETEDILLYQSNPVGHFRWVYINCTISAQKSRRANASFDLFSRKQSYFWSKRKGYTPRSQTTAFCSYEKSYTTREDMSARLFINAISTSA